MDLVPAETALPTAPLTREHLPRPGDYKTYRACARWDFGFTCAFCFLHEGDVAGLGAEGTGLMWLEHLETQTASPAERDEYKNLAWSCRFCNDTRGSRHSHSPAAGPKLLNPVVAPWASHFHFELESSEAIGKHVLREKSATDADAVLTRKAYHLDAANKTELRTSRHARIAFYLQCESDMIELVPRLLAAAREQRDQATKKAQLDAAKAIEVGYTQALREVRRHEAVPHDAPAKCRCTAQHALPEWLRSQLISCDPLS